MEQHPVPQNVTTFQFRLIGDMTIKQFGYLAGGAIAGYICYKLPLPFFFDWPLAVVSVLLGIGLAFVPIEERPMDVWLLSFIKSVYSPTQYLWSREPRQEAAAGQKTQPPPVSTPPPSVVSAPLAAPAIKPAPAAPIITTTKPASPSLVQTLEHLFGPAGKPTPVAHPIPAPLPRSVSGGGPAVILTQQAQRAPWDPFGFLKDIFSPKPRTTSAPPPVSSVAYPAGPQAGSGQAYPDIFANAGPLPSLTGKRLDLTQAQAPTGPTPQEAATIAREQLAGQQAAQKEKELTEKLEKMQSELMTKTTSDARILELQQQLTGLLSERGTMEKELSSLRTKLTQAGQTPRTVQQAGVVTAPQVAQPTVRVITPETAIKAGLPRLTTFPNVVTGIIKDAEGNLLPAVLVTVRDKDEIPVRALKTNKLGQFAASTPLPNGTYTIDIEDPRSQHFFDRARITLNGSIMAPVEITSKSKKEMDRSKLAAEIFGTKEI